MKKAISMVVALCLMLSVAIPGVFAEMSGTKTNGYEKDLYIYSYVPGSVNDGAPSEDEFKPYQFMKDAVVGELQGEPLDIWGRTDRKEQNYHSLLAGQSNVFKVAVDANATSLVVDDLYQDSSRNFTISLSADNTAWSQVVSYGTTEYGYANQAPINAEISKQMTETNLDANKAVLANASVDSNGKKVVYIKFAVQENGQLRYVKFRVATARKSTVTGISLSTAPAKTSYFTGEPLDVTGGKVTVTRENDPDEIVDLTASMVTGFESETAGTKTLTITYQEKTTTFDVTVSEVTLTKIEWKTEPTKKNYSVGESLDVTGGVITATYSDNSTKDIDVTADMVSGFNSAAVAEQQALTVTYGTKTLVYNIEVTEPTGTKDYEFRFDASPLNVEDADEAAQQKDIWDNKVATKPEVVDGGAFLKDSQFAKTIMQWNDVYMNVESEGYLVYEIDLNDRAVNFTIGGWGAYKNCKFLASKDDGKTWYLISEVADQTNLGDPNLPAASLNAEQCKKNIEWILTGNPEKKFLFKMVADEFDTQIFFVNVILKTTYNTGAAIDLPTTVPADYEIPEAYNPGGGNTEDPGENEDPGNNESSENNNSSNNNNAGSNDDKQDTPEDTGVHSALPIAFILLLTGRALIAVTIKKRSEV